MNGPSMPVTTLELIITASLFGVWFAAVPIYAIRVLFKGRYRSAKVDQKGGTFLLGSWLMEFGYWFLSSLGRGLAALRISPNAITIGSLALAIGAGVSLYFGKFGYGGWLMLTAAILDVLDGMVARSTGTVSVGGWYLDSVIDRYCELAIFTGFLGYFFRTAPLAALVVGLSMVASIMITFARTKGESLGITGIPSGLMRRHERLFYIGVGTAVSPLVAILLEPGAAQPLYHVSLLAHGVVALFGNITAVKLVLAFHRRIMESGVQMPAADDLLNAAPAADAAEAELALPAGAGGGTSAGADAGAAKPAANTGSKRSA